MTLQYSTTLRTNQASQIQTTVGSSGATLKIYTGAEPANAAAAETGTLLVSIPLPAAFLTSASGAATLSGSWTAAAVASGVAGHFRILDTAGNVHLQGDCVNDLVLQNTNIANGQTVTVTAFTVTTGNA